MQSSALNQTYTDFSGLNELRAQARVDPQASLKQVAKQFEGIFIQMMLKSMRDAGMGDDIFDSDQSKLYRDMFDKQVSLDMANSKGIGIADSLVRQLGRNTSNINKPDKLLDTTIDKNNIISGKILPHSAPNLNMNRKAPVKDIRDLEIEKTQFKSPQDFTQHILPHAKKAAQALGISPLVLIAQAALETGWGKSVTRHKDGSSSFNLFNIKADQRWEGEHVIKTTLEYNNGIAKQEKASFRSYDSYTDGFTDYVDFLRKNSRYDNALHHQGDDKLFIKDLQKAGYATDPKYADKVLDIMSRETIQSLANTDNQSEVTG